MGAKFNFDTANNVEMPTMVLTHKSGERINNIFGIEDLQYVESMQNPIEFSFKVYKKMCNVWDDLKTFRHIWVREWNDWYVIEVEKSLGDSSVKKVNAKHLPEYELANAKITTEINTESDATLASDTDATIIYNPEKPKKSVLNRILEPMQAFEIGYVTPSLQNLVYNFSFSDVWIYDALAEVAEQLEAHFEFSSYTDEQTGEIHRVVNLYDLNPYCAICHTRLDVSDKQCTNEKCSSTEICEGYGEDTSVFLSLDNVLNSVTYTTNTDEVKNCFKLEASDDIMTGYILSCNPNGSQYIWYMDTFLDEMSDTLRQSYEEYIENYNSYNTDKIYSLYVSDYNNLVQKYRNMYVDESKIPDSLVELNNSYKGYSSIVKVLYSTESLSTYLETTLMPTTSIGLTSTTALEQANNLLDSITSVAINDEFSSTVAKNAVLDMAKAIIDSRYSVKITEYEATKQTSNTDDKQVGIWKGTFYVENYSDEEDYAEISTSSPIVINKDFENYLIEKLNKVLEKGENKNYGTSALFDLEKDIEDFKEELNYYGLSSLESFKKCCDENISVLIDQKIGTETNNLYEVLYVPYDQRSKALASEIAEREAEINVISEFQERVQDVISEIQEKLDLQNHLEKDNCWVEFCSLRREDTYSNSNYTSDGLTKAEILEKASQFMEVAKKELVKSATLQHSISVSLKNIFTIKEFKPILDNFKIGNWIRVEVDDEIFKLRLIEYSCDFSDLTSMEVEFSDVTQIGDDINDIQDLVSQMRSISGNYSYVERQAEQGQSSYDTISQWFQTGLNATQTKIVNSADNVSMMFDSAGLLGRRYKDFSDNEFEDEQMRLINNSLVFTRDNWKSICTAVGKFYYVSGQDSKGSDVLTSAYGINGEVIAGKLFIGQNLKMYNTSGSLTFDENGFIVRTYDSTTSTLGDERMKIDTNGDITLRPKNLIVNTADGGYIDIQSKNFTVTKDGNVNITGVITANSGSIGGWTANSDTLYSNNASNRSGLCSNASKYAFWAGETNSVYGASNTDAKFKVGHNGNLVATSANISGTITATTLTTVTGNIGCWKFDQSRIYDTTSSAGINKNGSGQAFWAGGSDLTGGSAPFRVNHAGYLCATNATITGVVNATSGSIGSINFVSARDASLHCYGESLITSTDISLPVIEVVGDTGNRKFIQTTIQGGIKNVYTSTQLVFFIKGKPTSTATWYGAGDGNLFYVKANGEMLARGLYLAAPFDLETDSSADGLLRYSSTNDYYIKTLITYNDDGNIGDWAMYLNYVKFKTCGVFSNITPSDDGNYKLGTSDHKWSEIWSKHSLNTSSDRNLKKDIKELTEVHKRFFMKLIPVSYMFTEPGSDRTHIGFIAQDVEQAMNECGLTSLDFAGLCKDIKRERVSNDKRDTRMKDVYDEYGNPVYIYSLRYTEFIAIIAYVLQDNVNRLDKLEQLVNQLING